MNQIAKVKTQYSYYLGDLVTCNELAVCYVVRTEEIRVLLHDGSKLLLKGHAGQVFDLRFCPAAPRLLASACRGGRVHLWDVSVKQEAPLVVLLTEDAPKPDVYASKLAWHRSQQVLAVACCDDSVVVVDVETLSPGSTALLATTVAGATRIICASAVHDLCFAHRDKDVLATAHHDGTFLLWNWRTGHCLWEKQGHRGSPMHAVRFLQPSGSKEVEVLLTAGQRCEELKLWDLEHKNCLSTVTLRAPASGANPFYNHVMPVGGAEDLVLVANAKRKDFLCIHIAVGANSGPVFDSVSVFDVSQPILSGIAKIKQNGEISLHCVQESRVQEYLLPRDMCVCDPAEAVKPTGRSSADAATVIQAAARAYLARKETMAQRAVSAAAGEARAEEVAREKARMEEKKAEDRTAEGKKMEENKARSSEKKKAATKKADASISVVKGQEPTVQKVEKVIIAKREQVDQLPDKQESLAVTKRVEPVQEGLRAKAESEATLQGQIGVAFAASLAPLMEAMEHDRLEAKKRHAAEVERQKKFLQVLQSAIEVQIPKVVEAAVHSAMEKRGASKDASAALGEEVRRCFSELLIPRLERGVAAALSQVGKAGPLSQASDLELRGELRGLVTTLGDLSRHAAESITVSHHQALANHTAALTAVLDAVSHRSRALNESSDSGIGPLSASPALATGSVIQTRKKALLQSLKSQDFNAALTEVLSMKDVTWVMWLLKKIGDPDKVFANRGCVGQPVVLSLVQQLGFGFPGDEEGVMATQLQWIQSALLVLDLESPDVGPHVSAVLGPLLVKIEAAYPKWSSSPIQQLFKVVCHVLHSLLRS